MNCNRRELLKGGVAISAGSVLTPSAAGAMVASSTPRAGNLNHQATWNSLRNIPAPSLLREGKFGIYTPYFEDDGQLAAALEGFAPLVALGRPNARFGAGKITTEELLKQSDVVMAEGRSPTTESGCRKVVPAPSK